MKPLISLFFTMLKIGLFTFGGGYAMIGILEHEFVEKKQYLEKDEFLDMVAIAESTPGPIAINAATYIGYRRHRFLGALLCTVAICIPSLVIIYLISLFFDTFLSLSLVANAFRGIRVCVVYLVLSAGLKMLKNMKKDALRVTLFSLVLVSSVTLSLLAFKFSTVLYILICGVIGITVDLLCRLRAREGKK